MEFLAPLVYDQLRAIAEAFLHKERPGPYPAAHRGGQRGISGSVARAAAGHQRSRAFFAFAAQLTRRVLIDSARKAKAEKRGLGWTRIPLDAELAWLSDESSGDRSICRRRLTNWPSSTRSRPAPSNCIISWVARWRRQRIFCRSPRARWSAACVFPWPGCAGAFTAPEGPLR